MESHWRRSRRKRCNPRQGGRKSGFVLFIKMIRYDMIFEMKWQNKMMSSAPKKLKRRVSVGVGCGTDLILPRLSIINFGFDLPVGSCHLFLFLGLCHLAFPLSHACLCYYFIFTLFFIYTWMTNFIAFFYICYSFFFLSIYDYMLCAWLQSNIQDFY